MPTKTNLSLVAVTGDGAWRAKQVLEFNNLTSKPASIVVKCEGCDQQFGGTFTRVLVVRESFIFL
jgi:hypothetical protein